MKRISTFLIFFLLLSASTYGFLYEVNILDKEQIAELSNDDLLNTYIDVMIERRASETFHGRAGFSPKEYGKFKELLGYIIKLRQEMTKRGMDVPPIEDWLR